MDLIEIVPDEGAPPAGERRRGNWVMPLSPWVVAVVLAAALLWVLPRAADGRAAGARATALAATLRHERTALSAAGAALSGAETQYQGAQTTVMSLERHAKESEAEIARLKAQVTKLREEKARLSAPPAVVPPPPVPPPCYPVPNQFGGYDWLCP